LISILLGLGAAVTWGAADFAGGIATRRTESYSVVIGSHIISLTAFLFLALLLNEPVPPLHDWLLGGAAGLGGGIGLMLLYRALAGGKMSIAASVSAVVAATIPVIADGITQGLPATLTLIGFATALLAVWLVSSGDGYTKFSIRNLMLPLSAGVVFGLFFILLREASRTTVAWPVVATRVGSISGLLLYAALTNQRWIPTRQHWPLLAFIGVVDAGGTALYALSARLGRMDVAAVLGSLYPGATVLLARVFLKEKISRIQALGILLALCAIILLTL